MKKFLLTMLLVLLSTIFVGCQSGEILPTNEGLSDNSSSNEVEQTSTIEENIYDFLSDYYIKVIEQDRDSVASMIEARFGEASSETSATNQISMFFKDSIESVDILINKVNVIEDEKENYYTVDFSIVHNLKSGEKQPKDEKFNLVSQDGENFKILTYGLNGKSTNLLELAHVKSAIIDFNALDIYDGVHRTYVEFEFINASDYIFGLGVMNLVFQVSFEMKDGNIIEFTYDKSEFEKGKGHSFNATLDIPYNEFIENIQYIYVNNMDVINPSTGMPYLGEESRSLLLYSAGEDTKLFSDKINELNN